MIKVMLDTSTTVGGGETCEKGWAGAEGAGAQETPDVSRSVRCMVSVENELILAVATQTEHDPCVLDVRAIIA